MEILCRFDGRNGQITIAQERRTGARLYVEEGVKQSYVLPGGSAGLDYLRLMVRAPSGRIAHGKHHAVADCAGEHRRHRFCGSGH
jgi:hypothetical protein